MDQKSWVQKNSDLLFIGVIAGRESWDVRGKAYGCGSAAGAQQGWERGAGPAGAGSTGAGCAAWGPLLCLGGLVGHGTGGWAGQALPFCQESGSYHTDQQGLYPHAQPGVLPSPPRGLAGAAPRRGLALPLPVPCSCSCPSLWAQMVPF